MKSMTYGTMPTFEEFEAAFDEKCVGFGYHVTLGRTDSVAVEGYKLGDGYWKAQELYDACKQIVDEWSEETEAAMSLVSSIMETLLFEWV